MNNSVPFLKNCYQTVWLALAVLWALLISAQLCAADVNGIVLSAEEIRKAGEKYGEMAERRLNTWQKLIRKNQDKNELEKLKLVNDFFNQVRFISDSKHWGKDDYWATPTEMLGTNGADCEDYSIAKYLTLRQLGVADDKLRIIYVKSLSLNQAHMVVSYYPQPDAVPLILDNLNKRVLEATKRTDLVPIYSFNGSGLWVGKGRGGDKKAGSSSRLKRWNDVKARLKRGN